MVLKRKHESKISETVKKSSKIEGSEVKKKPLTKAELMANLKALEDKSEKLAKENVKHLETNEKLSKENAKHLDTIEKLESCIKSMQRNYTSSIANKAESSAQTEIDEFCNVCDYPARDMWELGEHLYECHTSHAKFACNFCGEKYWEKGDLMRHIKSEHSDKVSMCRDYAEGNCTFSDDMCWFSHSEEKDPGNTTEYNCDLCNKVFTGRFDFMKHRKQEHKPAVMKCRHALYGTCMFGEDKCWFVHETDKNEKMIQNNQEVFERLFNMMEKMTSRIVQLETVI